MDGPSQCFLVKMSDLHRHATPSDKRSGFSSLKWASSPSMMLTCATSIFGEWLSAPLQQSVRVEEAAAIVLKTLLECKCDQPAVFLLPLFPPAADRNHRKWGWSRFPPFYNSGG